MEKRSFAVLIVERDPIVALDLQGIMLNIGHDVVASVSEADAAVAAAGRFKPDVVLMGGEISGGKSWKTAERIIKEFGCPVIFCLSPYERETLAAVKNLASCEVVFKPVNAEALAAVIDMLIYKHELEKSIILAEEKVRRLTGAADIWDEFQNKKYAFRWKLDFSGFSFCDSIPEIPSVEPLKEKITECISGLGDGVFSFLVDVCIIPFKEGKRPDFVTAVFCRKKNGTSQGYMIALKNIF